MRYFLVDAFADDEHRGNPAAVVELPQLPDEETMQEAARVLAVPTTAFVAASGPGEYDIAWFTPSARINLCGHATLAAARVLFAQPGSSRRARLGFRSGADTLVASREGGLIALDLPAAPVTASEPPAALLEALGVGAVRSCATSHDDILVELETAADVAALAPDFAALAGHPYRGHIVTADAARAGGADFVVRTFFPSLGVDEDQVCVSAHCKLAPFWADRLGRRRMTSVQLSERGGRLEVEVRGSRVLVLGSAVPRGAEPVAVPLDRVEARVP